MGCTIVRMFEVVCQCVLNIRFGWFSSGLGWFSVFLVGLGCFHGPLISLFTFTIIAKFHFSLQNNNHSD